jgi:hypothetical protein
VSDKRPGKDPGVHVHTSTDIVDDLRPKGKRAALERAPALAAEPPAADPPPGADPPPAADPPPGASATANQDDLPLPEAPAEPDAPARGGNAKKTMPSTPRAKGIPAPDPRVPDLEKAIARGDWQAVVELLGASGAPSELAPPLRLIWAVATKEARANAGSSVDNVAIEALAEILGLAKQSPIALVIAKRTLRRRTWASAPAPSAALSSAIIVGGLAIGLGLGWLLTVLWM